MRKYGMFKGALVVAVVLSSACGSSNDAASVKAVSGGATGVAAAGGVGSGVTGAGGVGSGVAGTTLVVSGGSSGGITSASSDMGGGAATGGITSSTSTVVTATGGATSPSTTSGGTAGSSIVVSSFPTGGFAQSGSGGALTSPTGGVPTVVTTGGTTNSASGGASSGGASGTKASGGSATAGSGTCAPRGGVGNNQSYGDALAPIPLECTSDAGCTNGICYIGPAAQTRSCRSPCSVASVGTQGDCNAGQLCTLMSGGSRAACLDTCTPFAASSPCLDGDWCYPMPHTSFTAGVQVPGLCLPAGEYPEGVRCPGGGCASGLLCSSPRLVAFDTYHCEPACDPAATLGQPGACAAGESCIPEVAGRGYCAHHCEPFGQTNQCPNGEWCYPFHTQTGTKTGVEGRCVRTGKHPRGAICSVGECDAGLKCVQAPLPSQYDLATCQPICDPSAAAACLPGEVCIADRASGKALSVGTCQKSCQAFESDPCRAGCASNEWCAPASLEPGFGVCMLVGTRATGATCDSTRRCGVGDVCQPKAPGASALDNVCQRTCVPSENGIDSAHCLSGEVCVAERLQDHWTAYGVCRGACDHDNGVPCARAGETCVTGAVIPQGKDACYDLRNVSCLAYAYGGEACGATAVCTADLIVPQCTDICRIFRGAIGTNHHPDCPDATSTCDEIAPGLAYGACS